MLENVGQTFNTDDVGYECILLYWSADHQWKVRVLPNTL